MKISILGCGWVGYPLALYLVEKGHRVHGASRNPAKLESLAQQGIHPHFIDLTPAIQGDNLTEFFSADLMIITIPPGRKRPKVTGFYPKAIENIVTTATHQNCHKFLFTSSTGVYGSQEGMVTETSPLLPNSLSAEDVVRTETYLLNQPGIEVTILRLAGLVGPDRHPGRWLAGRKALPNGDAPVNLVHQTDVVRSVVASIQNWAPQQIFNVCAAKHPSKSEYYTFAAKQLGL